MRNKLIIPKMTKTEHLKNIEQLIKFLIVSINFEHFSKDFEKHIYFKINKIRNTNICWQLYLPRQPQIISILNSLEHHRIIIAYHHFNL